MCFGDAKVWTILPYNIVGFAIQKQWDGLFKVTIFMEMHDVSQAMELDDVTNVFYEHTNPSSRLREIGRS